MTRYSRKIAIATHVATCRVLVPGFPPTLSGLISRPILPFSPYFNTLEFHDRYHGAQHVKKAREMATAAPSWRQRRHHGDRHFITGMISNLKQDERRCMTSEASGSAETTLLLEQFYQRSER
jgi:hypothetical protein